MYKDKETNESALANVANEQAYEALKIRLLRRIRRAQRALNERAGIELPTVQAGRQ